MNKIVLVASGELADKFYQQIKEHHMLEIAMEQFIYKIEEAKHDSGI